MATTKAAKTAKKGNLKIDLRLHARLKAKAALLEPSKGVNQFAEEHLWPAVGGQIKAAEQSK